MADLRLLYNGLIGHADFVQLGATLDTSEDLATAVTVSLFSDRLVDPNDPIPPNTDDRRGWWGDSYADDPHDLIGSRLWLLERSKSDNNLPARARDYILEALQWLLDDGVAARVDVSCFFLFNDQRRLGAIVVIWRPGVATPVSVKFDWAWQQLGHATPTQLAAIPASPPHSAGFVLGTGTAPQDALGTGTGATDELGVP